MAIFLLVLKIIGIVLLCIIGFVLFVLCLVLFVPFRYRIKADKGIPNDDIKADIKISWLLHIITVKAFLDFKSIKNMIVNLYIIGIKKNLIPGKKSKSDDLIHENVQESESESDKNTDDSGIPSVKELNNNESSLYKLEGFDETASKTDNHSVSEVLDEDESIEDSIKNEAAQRISMGEKLKGFIDFLSNIYTKITEAINNFKNNSEKSINRIKSEYKFYDKFIHDDKNQKAIKTGLAEILRILKSIKPRKIRGKLVFGFDDPAKTGQVLGYISMFYPLFYKRLKINPLFDENIIHGNIDIKGHISLIVIVFAAARFYFNKNIRRMMAIYKRHKNKKR